MDNREEFEKWAIEEGYDVDRINGKYIFPATYKAWNAWQARQKEIDVLKARVVSFNQWPNVDALRQCMIDTAEENAVLRAEIEELKKWTEDNHNPGNIHE